MNITSKSNIKVISFSEWIIFGLLIGWLTLCAFNVDIEPYDGLDTIVNAHNFTGQSEYYAENRAPLMSFFMVPAEIAHKELELNPFDLWPYHVTMALMHGLYLFLVYLLLVRFFHRSITVLLSFVATIPNFIFLSYAPFISHDIFPGLLLLGMLLLAHKFIKNPGINIWLSLVIIGAASALIKHSYALFWMMILLAYAFLFLQRNNSIDTSFSKLKIWLLLAAAAITSGIITWLTLAVVLNDQYPDTHIIMGPYKQLEFLFQNAGGSTQFPVWVLLRNFPAYGILTTLLIIPGLIMSLRRSLLEQSIVLVWIFFLLALQLTQYREVRYLAVLAPLTAVIMLPPLEYILRNKVGIVISLLLLLINILPFYKYSLFNEAMRITLPFYRNSEARILLEPLNDNGNLRAPVLTNWKMLSFASPLHSPLAGDRYHRLFHIARHHVVILMGYQNTEVIFLQYLQLPELSGWPERSALLLTNRPMLTNPKSWQGGVPIGKYDLLQTTYLADSLSFSPDSTDILQSDTGETMYIKEKNVNNHRKIFLESTDVLQQFRNSRFLRLEIGKEKQNYFPLKINSSNQMEVLGLYEKSNILEGQRLIISGFELKASIKYEG